MILRKILTNQADDSKIFMLQEFIVKAGEEDGRRPPWFAKSVEIQYEYRGEWAIFLGSFSL